MKRDGQPLVLEVGPLDAGHEPIEARRPGRSRRVALQPVVADEDELRHAHDPARVLSLPAADTGDEGVAAVQAAKLGLRLRWDASVLRTRHDRRERPVDVQEDRGPRRIFGQAGDEIHAA